MSPTSTDPRPAPTAARITRYHVAIAMLVAMQLTNALGEAIPLPEVLESFEHTGLPRSLLGLLVATKLASAVALLLPGRPVLKEWAFAGIFVDVVGAAACYLLAGHPEALGLKLVPLALVVWGVAYWQHRAAPHRRAEAFVRAEARPARIARWLLAGGVLVAAVGELLRAEPVMESLRVIHFPATILTILVVAKLLAVLALTVPGWPRLRIWAQAGLAFNFAGALYSYAHEGVLLLPDVPLLLALSGLLAIAVRGGPRLAHSTRAYQASQPKWPVAPSGPHSFSNPAAR